MTVNTIRITSIEELKSPEIQQLLLKTMSSNKLVRDPVKASLELAMRIAHEDLGLFIAGEDDELTGCILVQRSRTELNPACIVLHLYVTGGERVRNALLGELLDYARDGGFTDIIAIDTNNKPNAFGKLFSVAGSPTKLGDVFHFDMNESLL